MALTLVLAGVMLALLAVWLSGPIARLRRVHALVSPIPGLRPVPFIGNALSFARLPSVPGLPRNAMIFQLLCGVTHLFEKEKIISVWMSFHPTAVFFKPESMEIILTKSNLGDKSFFYRLLDAWLGNSFLTSGAIAKVRRKMIMPAFNLKHLEEFVPAFDAHASTLINKFYKLCHNDYVSILPPVTLCTLDIIAESAMGIQLDAQHGKETQYVQSIKQAGELFIQRCIKPWLYPDFIYFLTSNGRRFKHHISVLHDFTRKVIRQRKEEILQRKDGDDSADNGRLLLDLLLHFHIHEKSLTEDDIREEVDTFMFAGHDTSALGIGWALYNIGLYPKIQARLHEEIDSIFQGDLLRPITPSDLKELKYLECVLKESQRLYPAVPFIGRITDRELQIGGYTLPKGCTCFLFTYMLHRNPEVYPEPEKFDPDRFLPENCLSRHPFAYLPFSAGPRNCLGQKFAMLEMKTVVANILRNFTWETLDPPDQIHLVAELVLRPVEELRLRMRPRNTPSY